MISLDVENYCHNCPKFEPECKNYMLIILYAKRLYSVLIKVCA